MIEALSPNCDPSVPLVPVANAADSQLDMNVVRQIESDEEHEFAFLDPPQQPDELGRLGNYRVLRLLGSGAMGTVFDAEDLSLLRPVALKVMNTRLATDGESRQRFLREAQATAALEHDHIVHIYEVGQHRGLLFLAMQRLRGETLAARVSRPPRLPLAEVLRIGREIATGLQAAHERGLVHRDIKPSNLWLEAGHGRVKILDFGLARNAANETGLTQSGVVVGTPVFMSPEQAQGRAIDARSDLFSLGSVFYQMSTGELPFQRADTVATLVALSTQQPERPERYNPELPPALCELIMALLAKDTDRRPATARDVAQRLQQLEWEQAARSPLVVRANAPEGSDTKGHWAWKASGAAFATLVAPILVAIGVKYTDVMLPPVTPDNSSQATPPVVSPSHTGPPVASPPVAPVANRPAQNHAPTLVVSPGEVRLFNGRDLTGFSKYLGPAATGQPPLGKNHDPQHVFSVRQGLLRVSGETTGALLTNRDYQNYHLTVEYKWGERTWPPRLNRARMSGILLHAGKADGVVRDAWPSAIKCEIGEGCTGDLVILAPEGSRRV
ncbi:MAG TPA: protein kinase, partial [Pirellulales bacterium]|nr:protein kinase [Pirellulales bacterium]